MADNYEREILPRMYIPKSFFMTLVIYLMLPFGIALLGLDLLCTYRSNYGALDLKNGQEYSGVNKCAISKDISVDDLKRVAHEHNVSLNDVISAVLSSAMHKYLKKRGEKDMRHL